MIIRYKPFGCRAIGLVAAVSTIVLISATVEAGAQFKQLDPSDTRVVVPKYRVKPRAATICPRHRYLVQGKCQARSPRPTHVIIPKRACKPPRVWLKWEKKCVSP